MLSVLFSCILFNCYYWFSYFCQILNYLTIEDVYNNPEWLYFKFWVMKHSIILQTRFLSLTVPSIHILSNLTINSSKNYNLLAKRAKLDKKKSLCSFYICLFSGFTNLPYPMKLTKLSCCTNSGMQSVDNKTKAQEHKMTDWTSKNQRQEPWVKVLFEFCWEIIFGMHVKQCPALE